MYLLLVGFEVAEGLELVLDRGCTEIENELSACREVPKPNNLYHAYDTVS